MAFDYFYGRGTEQFAFYQIPKVLITDDRFAEVSLEAKFLYSLMLDRAALSAKNGWLDEKGRVYIYYTLEQVMTDLRCANQKATKLLKDLYPYDRDNIHCDAAYLRKMALNGSMIQMDLSDVKEMIRLLRINANNLNQYTRKAKISKMSDGEFEQLELYPDFDV